MYMKNITLTDEVAYEKCAPRFWVSLLISIPFVARDVEPWLAWILATCVLVTGAWPFIEAGFRKKCNRFTLISLSILLLYGVSVLEFLISQKPDLFFELAAYLTIVLLFGMLVQKALFQHLLEPLKRLTNPLPKKAKKILAAAKIVQTDTSRLVKGDCVRVDKGEILPVDGLIINGNAELDESLLTAKKGPVKKGFGDIVFAGTKNLAESIVIQAKHTADNTQIMQIASSMTRALSHDLSHNPRVDTIKQFLIPLIIVFSLLCFFFWLLFSGLAGAVLAASSVLLIANPKAFQVSAGITSIQALLQGVKEGIIIRCCDVFNKILLIDTLVCDKSVLTYLRNRHDALQLLKKEKITLFEKLLVDEPHKKLQALRTLKKQKKSVALLVHQTLDEKMVEYVDLVLGVGPIAPIFPKISAMLIKPDLLGIVYLRKLAKQTEKNINRNFFIASLYNTLFVILAAFGLFSPVTSALVMIVSMLAISLLANKNNYIFA